MKYRKLGHSDLEVSEISFGCMSLAAASKESHSLLNKALNAGINFFDTADLYDQGENEISVGQALKEKRKQVILATKVGNQWRKDGTGWEWNPTKEYILKAIDDSLTRLKTDYIDLYQLHGGTIQDPMDETIEAFERLIEIGKIRYYGISSIRPNVIRAYVSQSNISSVMMQYSLLDRRPEETCIKLLADNNIGLLARGVLGKGLLAGKEPTEYLDFTLTEIKSIQDTVLQISGGIGPHVAMHFVLSQPSVFSLVIGVRTREQLDQVIKAYGQNPPSPASLSALRTKIPVHKYTIHR